MARLSNVLVGFLNILTLIASVAIMASSFFLRSTECQNFFQFPVLILGACLCVVSLLGLFGSLCRLTLFSFIYQFILFVSILGLIVFTLFTLIVINKTAGDRVSGLGYNQHRLGDFSHWLQKRVTDSANWEKIKSCISDAKVCQGTPTSSYMKHLASIQSGCCNPPSTCDSTSSEPDCDIWSNDQHLLCYDCTSCKVSFLDNLRSQWRTIAFTNVGALALLIIIYSFGCCAYKNNRKNGNEGDKVQSDDPMKDNRAVHNPIEEQDEASAENPMKDSRISPPA
ncbi:tetraspanin-8-like [Aristolochia californica]|uniref:tetraspanin-8-like n=1 Tax=Aristolochia californica TaxID=171875 RepID=UPI0035E214BF